METHRGAVLTAILDAAATLVAGHSAAAVTMSGIAQTAGIGRATLYKYYPDVETILAAWHERQVHAHLEVLTRIRDSTRGAREQLEAVLEAYAFLSHSGHGAADAVALHQGAHMGPAERHLSGFLTELLRQGAEAGVFRGDVAADELAAFCLHALEASAGLTSPEAVHRLVKVTLAGLHPVP
ncbi:TetR/AcrR family transcriptional regulator [Pseudarthrobacter sp. AB1]|uniref:TetR/AcrR family transcriptional regulator n=1 Tax=Pseudarthrobacter sp. AB1 TaxID=2138309 RepID=UPI00281537D7|nr:TetR/AcrR family transcriptional regulator [Pseudarthrobacter sp. AB1]